MLLGEFIRQYRSEHRLSQSEYANISGISKGYISMLEQNKHPKTGKPIAPSYTIFQKVASSMGISVNHLMAMLDADQPIDIDSSIPSPAITEDTITFPVLVDVAAGYDRPAQMLQNWEGEKIEVPRSYLHGRNPEDYFAMRVVGDSMYPDYQDGDVLLILRQSALDRSGQVAVVIYDGEDATLKKVEYVPEENWMKLLPINPQYPPRTITGVDLDQCRILGLPKVLVRSIK